MPYKDLDSGGIRQTHAKKTHRKTECLFKISIKIDTSILGVIYGLK